MPIVGFGTWQIEGQTARRSVSDALELGYRHIDTATVYRNEEEVGRAIAESSITRGELFITTKVPGDTPNVRRAMEQSLDDLKLDYVDLWLIHWPPSGSYGRASLSSLELFEKMLALRAEGLTRAVGVSNYSIAEVDDLISATGDSPEVNQIPWSPFLHDFATRRDLDDRSVRLEGYSPFKTSQLHHRVLEELARSHGVTAAQVLLRWHVQQGVVVIPKSVHKERIRENLDIFSFELGLEEMEQLGGLASS